MGVVAERLKQMGSGVGEGSENFSGLAKGRRTHEGESAR